MRIMPCGCASTSINCCRCRPAKPSAAKSSTVFSLSSKRITTLSPYMVGIVDTRKSSSLPSICTLMRPSWGNRRSAIFSLAMILIREVTAAVDFTLGASISCKTPSTRSLTFKACSKGSICMSDALVSIARCIIKLTILITGASLAKSFKCSKSSSPKSSTARSSISLSIFDRSSPY